MGKSSRKKETGKGYATINNTPESSDRTSDARLSMKIVTQKTRHTEYFLAGIVSLITFLLYLPCLRNGFLIWDDRDYVTNNPMIRSINLELIKSAFFEFHASNWHPLTWISHAMDYAIWGLDPVGHHLGNVILHTLNTALVVIVTIRLIELYRYRTVTNETALWLKERGIMITGSISGLLFGLHPIHVESVAWVAERKDLLCALFFLMSILAYLKYVNGKSHTIRYDTARAGHFNILYFLSLGLFMLALLSKPMAVSLPFVLLIIDWYPSNRIFSVKSFGAVLIEKLPFILLSLGSSVLTTLAQKGGGAIVSFEAVPLSSRMLVANKSLVVYLLKIMLPTNLMPYYPYPSDASLFSLKYLSLIILTLLIMATCIVAARKQKLLLSVWGCYVVTLIPVLGVVQVGGQAMADRYAYLPSLGPFLTVGLAVAWVWGRADNSLIGRSLIKAIGTTFAVFLLITLGYLTIRQMRLWENDFTLWSYAIAKSVPEKAAFVYRNRAQAFSYSGQFVMAINDYSTAIALNPSSCSAYLNRGMAYNELGQFDRAIADFDKTIAICPSYYEAYNNKGMVYGKVASFDKAIEQFNKAIDINPHQPRFYCNRGLAYYLIEENDKALQDFNKAIDLDENYTDAYGSRGNLFLRIGSTELAILDFKKGCDLGDREGCRVLQNLTMR